MYSTCIATSCELQKMNKIELKEQPSLTITSNVKSILLHINNLILNTSCNVGYTVLDVDDKLITSGSILLDGADYTGWGSDDSYIETWLLGKLNLLPQVSNPTI